MNHPEPASGAGFASESRLADEAPAISLWRYANIIRKRIWIIAAVVAVGLAGVVVYTKQKPKIFSASASLIIEPTPPQVFGSQVQEVIQLGAGSYWSNQEYYNTQLQTITKYELVERTVRHRENARLTARLLGLPEDTAVFDDDQLRTATELLARMVGVAQTRESRIINVFVQHTDPQLAIDLANAHVETFYEYSKGVRGDDTREISMFLDQELQRAAERLSEAEKALLDFKKENDLLSVSLEDKQNILATDITEYTAALREARIARIKLGSLRARVATLSGADVMASPLFALTDEKDRATTVVDTLKEQYTREKHALAELGQELGPLHPEYKRQEKKVAEELAALATEAKRATRELEERYQSAFDSERKFAAEVERLKQEAFEIGPKTVTYNQLARAQRSAEENYQLLLGRRRASELTEKNRATNVSKHTRAREAVLVYPRMTVNVAIAGLLSLVIGLSLAFFLDLMDRTIKSTEDIEHMVGAPLLGTIPRVDDEDLESGDDRSAQRQRDLYVQFKGDSPVAEHCRSIRTNILFSSANRPMKTLTISSPQKSEGKTTAAIYLGIIMAQSNQRVLLVDTDMRRPRLHQSLLPGRSFQRGLSHLLVIDRIDDTELDGVIQHTDIPGLDVLPCGQRPPNPAELLLTERFKEILQQLEGRYDRVLLDSPPLALLNDAVVLSRLSDGVVMVAQAGSTSIDDVKRCARMVRDVDAPILGVILNNVSRADGNYYYYNYYYREYGDPVDEPPPSSPSSSSKSSGNTRRGKSRKSSDDEKAA